MSQKSEDKAKKESKREAINNNKKEYVPKQNETRRDTEYAEGHPWSKENLEKVAKERAQSKERAKRNESYYELLRRDKTASNYRKHEQNKKRMTPQEKAIDDWMATNYDTYSSKEKKIKNMAASMSKKGTKTGIKDLKKYENMHTLTPEERNTLHKAYGLKSATPQKDINKTIDEYKPERWKNMKSPSRQTQYESHQRTQRVNLVHEAQIHKGEKKHTDVTFKYGTYGINRRPSKAKPDVNATTGTRDTKSYVPGDKDSKYYANNDSRDYNYPTSIPKPPTTKNDEKKPAITPKKKTTKKSGGNSGNKTPIKNRTPEQLLNDVTGTKSSKGKSGATHKEGTKADYKAREEYEKYYKQQDKLKGGKK